MQYYAYITDTPAAPNMTDDRIGGDGRLICRDLRTVKGVVRRATRSWPDRSFKVFAFTNFYDDRTFRLVHTHWA